MSIVLDLIFSALTNCMPQVLGLKLDFITLCRIIPFFFSSPFPQSTEAY